MTASATKAGPVHALVDRLRQGDTRALARAISLVENEAPEARALLSACFPHTGSALRIGVTGSPGAGKSTLVDRLARAFCEAGRAVGIIAVDPTSPFTGGAILGDRIRFQERSGELQERPGDPARSGGGSGFYARSMATRGSLGGFAQTTADAALVLVPGMGDDVQSLKAGVMEIADIYVINKSDRDGADRVEQEIRALQSLAPAQTTAWSPPIVRTIATTGDGTRSLVEAITSMDQWLRSGDHLAERRTRHWQLRLSTMLRTELMRRARRNGMADDQLHDHAVCVASGHQDPWQLIADLSNRLFEQES